MGSTSMIVFHQRAGTDAAGRRDQSDARTPSADQDRESFRLQGRVSEQCLIDQVADQVADRDVRLLYARLVV
jgi:hypothetical protein